MHPPIYVLPGTHMTNVYVAEGTSVRSALQEEGLHLCIFSHIIIAEGRKALLQQRLQMVKAGH